MANSLPVIDVENDCEDQGFSRLEDGCLACRPEFVNGEPVYPALVKREVNGHWWWYCPNGHGSFGAVDRTAKSK